MVYRSLGWREGGGEEAGAGSVETDLEDDEAIDDALYTERLSHLNPEKYTE